MGDQTHRIERLLFEVVIDDPKDAKPLQVALSRIHRQKIEALVKRACDRIAGPASLLRIDHLSLDLGAINSEHFETEFVEALGRQLRSSLESVRADEARAQPTSEEQVALQEIQFFARTGALPWSSEQGDTKLLHRRMDLLLSKSSRSLAALLRELDALPQALERLASHFDDKTLGALVDTLLSPSRLRSIASEGDAVRAQNELCELLRGPGGLTEESPPHRRTQVWFSLLRAASRHRQGSDLLSQRLYNAALGFLSQGTGRSILGARKRLHELTRAPRAEHEHASAGNEQANKAHREARPSEPLTEQAPSAQALRSSDPSALRPADQALHPSEPSTLRPTEQALQPSDPSNTATDKLQSPKSPAAHPIERPQSPGEAVVSKRSAANSNDAEFVDLIAAWSQIAGELGETLGAQQSKHSGPPNQRARAQLKELTDALVSLAEAMQKSSKSSIAALLLGQHRRTPLPRAGVDFSLMALANAGTTIAKDSAAMLRRDLAKLRETIDPQASRDQERQRNPQVNTARPRVPSKPARAQKIRHPVQEQGIDQLHVDDAGLVILWPFLRHLFTHLELLEGTGFRDSRAQLRAAALLRLVTTGDLEIAEFQLPLAKILCGLEPDALFELDAPLGKEESNECTRMLEAMILRAPILKKMSVAGLRATFLLRPGILRVRDGCWLLRVEERPFDLVLQRFPWTFGWLKLPWMQTPLQVEWSL